MVTLGHSSSRLPAHLLSAPSLLLCCPGSGGWGQPQRGEDRLPRLGRRVRIPRERGAAHHAPPGWRVPPHSISLQAPASGRAGLGNEWLPLVRVGDPVLTETAGVISALSHLVTEQRQTASSGDEVRGAGPGPEAAENGRQGGGAAAGSVGLTHVDRSLCKCEEVCVQWVWAQGVPRAAGGPLLW